MYMYIDIQLQYMYQNYDELINYTYYKSNDL